VPVETCRNDRRDDGPSPFGPLRLETVPICSSGEPDPYWIGVPMTWHGTDYCENSRWILSYHKRLSFEVRSIESSFLVATCWGGFHLTQSLLQTDPIHTYE